MEKRIIIKENATLTDISVNMDNYRSGEDTFSVIAQTDYIYIGSRNPFNSVYFKLGTTVNAEVANASIYYWEGTAWVAAIDVIDETAVGGATLAQSGHITFSTNTDDGWMRESTNDNGDSVTGLATFNILSMYWLRINLSETVTTAIDLSWIGVLFSLDNDLYMEYPLFNRANMKAAFEPGKINWEEQHAVAAEIVINDLMDRNVIEHGGQLLDRSRLRKASVSKVAELIFNAFGSDYDDDAKKARNEYNQRISAPILHIDYNKNARIDVVEETKKQGWLKR